VRPLTLLVVGLVVAIGAAALVDAIRTGGLQTAPNELTEKAAVTPAERAEAAPFAADLSRHTDALHAADAVGLLVVADPDCRVELVPLPELERRRLDVCARRLVETGGFVVLEGVPVRPGDPLGTSTCVGDAAGARGCPAALRPDGALTVVRAGSLREIRLPDRDSRLLLSRGDLEWLLGQGPVELVEIAWATTGRLFAVVRRERAPRFVLAVIEDGRLVRSDCCFAQLRGLRASPRGTYADVRSEQGVLVYRRDGERIPLAPRTARPAAAVAFSPDERLVAVARGGAVDVLTVDERARTAVLARLPLEATDLRWVSSEAHVQLPDSKN
jgi:hypothetical protein